MPTEEEKRVIKERKLGLRVVDEGGRIDSGSCYYLYPPDDRWNGWDKLLVETAEIIAAASRPGKTLHLLGDVVDVRSGTFMKGFGYGRVTGHPTSVARAPLYGNEDAAAIVGWVKREIHRLVPTNHVVVSVNIGAAQAAEPSGFARCCAYLSYIFCCCRPGYALVDDDEIDLR
jgi:hypothetical protein